ncbi:MAG TPA: PAS domain S-box protein, partial [Spirochaetota bacterium]|nr:PAS domain S-box protein [Spirochaetota bacterium]
MNFIKIPITIIVMKKSIDDNNKLQLFSLAIEQSPSNVVITDESGDILYVNKKFCELTGYTSEEVIGKNPRILKSGKTPEERYKILWETILNGKIWSGEFCNKKKNGTFYWEQVSISPIICPIKGITNFVMVAEDITQKKLHEQEIENQNKFFNTVIESLNYPFLVIDTETYNVIMLNKIAQDFFEISNYSNPNFVKCYELIHKKSNICDTEEFVCPIYEFKTKNINSFSKNLTMKTNGKERYFEVYCYPILDENGKVVKIIEYFIDSTEKIENFRMLKQNKELYEILINNVKEYIYSVEFKNDIVVSAFHSPRCLEITGYTQEEYIYNPNLWFDMIYPDDKEKVLNYFKNLRNKLETDPIQHRIIDKFGNIKWVSNTSEIWIDDANDIIREVGFIIDITDKKETEDKIERLSRAVEQSPNTIVITDTKG